jgi:hypothetical protein
MPDSSDKAAERWWGNFLGGKRVPSQGVSNEDITGTWFTAEHKYRNLGQYSAEFRKAIQQYDANALREKASKTPRFPLVCFTFHGTRGQNARRFIMLEVFPKDENIEKFLGGLLERIKVDS